MEYLFPVFRALLLGSLVKLLLEVEKPWLCASLYAIGTFLVGLGVAHSLLKLAVFTVVTGLLSWALFGIMNKVRELSLTWWLLLMFGIPVAAMVWTVGAA
jgi:hypothetical protein